MGRNMNPLEGLKADYGVWQHRLAEIVANHAKAEEALRIIQTAELGGETDFKTKAEAQALLIDLGQKLSAANHKIMAIRKAIEAACGAEHDQRLSNLGDIQKVLADERTGAIAHIRRLQQEVRFLADHFLSFDERRILGINSPVTGEEVDFFEDWPGAKDFHRHQTELLTLPHNRENWVARQVLRLCGPVKEITNAETK